MDIRKMMEDEIAREYNCFAYDAARMLDTIYPIIEKYTTVNPIDKDGRPLSIGDRRYGADGREWKIVGIGKFGEYENYPVMGQDTRYDRHQAGGVPKPLKADWLSWKRPDSIDQINKDAMLDVFNYATDANHALPVYDGDRSGWTMSDYEINMRMDLIERTRQVTFENGN